MTTLEGQTQREPLPQLLGLGLLGTSWRLLAAHWWQLIAVAACAYVAQDVLMRAAVRAGGAAGAVPGLLVFALVPLAPLVATVLMLLVLRERQQSTGRATAFIAAIGSVLVPFLVVYESQGDLRENITNYFNTGFWEDYGVIDTLARIPEPASPLVLSVVAIAFLLRAVGARLAARDGLWEGRRLWLRPVLRVLIGYAEVVWIVLGSVVITAGLQGLHDWWQQRALGKALIDWWDGFSTSFPHLGSFGDWLVTAIGTLLDGVVTGVVTPLAWLAIGVVIYGLTAAQGIHEDEVVAAVQQRKRLGKVAQRVNPAVITLAWQKIADTEGRFGALLGGGAMILRSRFVPVIVFCVVYTVVATWVPYVIWDLARTLFPRLDYTDWLAAYGPLQAIAQIGVMVLTAAMLAAWADALLTRFGARSQLRLPDQPISSST